MDDFDKVFIQAVREGISGEIDIVETLAAFEAEPIQSMDGVRAVRDLLAVASVDDLVQQPSGQYRPSPLRYCTYLIQYPLILNNAPQEIEDAFRDEVLPPLYRVFDHLCEMRPDLKEKSAGPISGHLPSRRDDMMMALKIFAFYKTQEGADRIVRAARLGIEADSQMWSILADLLDEDHPQTNYVIDALRDPLPERFIAVALLDCANHMARLGKMPNHPFDTPEGFAFLDECLVYVEPERYTYATSATTALAWLRPEYRDTLMPSVWLHPSDRVRLEGAWVVARLGDQNGIDALSRFCHHLEYVQRAATYLEEMGRAEAIPVECDDEFRARAELHEWLSHPLEYGRYPDLVELYDTREMNWPPTDDHRELRLFKFYYFKSDDPNAEPVRNSRQEDEPKKECGDSGSDACCSCDNGGEAEPENDSPYEQVGIGMVGSVTFSLFGMVPPDMPPEDVYALHCSYELHWKSDPRTPEELSVECGRKILDEYNK